VAPNWHQNAGFGGVLDRFLEDKSNRITMG
jgi:hypothetical protein